jgi:hypothetical protein
MFACSSSLGYALAIPTNNGLGWKPGLPRRNSLAYYENMYIMDVNKFDNIWPWEYFVERQ